MDALTFLGICLFVLFVIYVVLGFIVHMILDVIVSIKYRKDCIFEDGSFWQSLAMQLKWIVAWGWMIKKVQR